MTENKRAGVKAGPLYPTRPLDPQVSEQAETRVTEAADVALLDGAR